MGNIDKHNVTTAMEENMIPLVPPGGANRVIDIDFSPDWLVSDATVEAH